MAARVSIRDVAARAGVSATTVSHVLNRTPGTRTSAATQERVRRAAEELGYSANAVARTLRTRRSDSVGFVGDEIATTPYAGELIAGAQEVIRAHDGVLLVTNTEYDAELEAREVRELLDREVDGVLCAYSFTEPHLMLSSVFCEYMGLRPAFSSAIQAGGATACIMLAHAVALVRAGMCRHVLLVTGDNRLTGMPPGGAVAALAALESLLSARVADGMADRPRSSPNRELVGQGLANVAAGAFGGIRRTPSISYRRRMNTERRR